MRDGIGLTLLGGIMRASQHDFRIMVGISLLQAFGIHSRDQQATEYRRAHYSVSQQGMITSEPSKLDLRTYHFAQCLHSNVRPQIQRKRLPKRLERPRAAEHKRAFKPPMPIQLSC